MRTHIGTALAALGLSLLAPATASASTQFVGNTTCPSYVKGGGGCHYVQVDRTVAGSTGTMRTIVFYHMSSGGSTYEVYDTRLQNNTSRAQSLVFLATELSNGANWQEITPSPQGIPTGGYVWDQTNRISASFQGTWFSVGQHIHVGFELQNSGICCPGYQVQINSDSLP